MANRLSRALSRSAALAALAGALALAGCASLRDSKLEIAQRDTVAAEVTLASDARSDWPQDDWWQKFGDVQLDTLIAEGLENAPDIEAAAARVRKVDAMARQAGASLLPRVDAQASAGLDKQSYNIGFPKEFVPKGWLDRGQIAATLGFDPDIWGRNRAALAAATSQAEAAAIDERQARLVLASAIASAYFDLSRLFAERDIRKSALDIRLASQKLVSAKYRGGLETRGSLRQADAGVATARAGLDAADRALALRRNQIAALMGAGPDRGLTIERPAVSGGLPDGLPDGVTTELVGRRPDIAAARARVEVAASRIKVARADFFPAIRLDALIGLQSLGIDTLLEKDSLIGSVGPAISLPIFHGGELTGRYREAEAGFEEALAVYDGTVVNAYREVADAAVSRTSVESQLGNAKEALAASEEAYSVARLRYDGGLSTYLDVLAVEDRLLEARLAVATLEAASRSLDIALIRALGGGFIETAGLSAKDTPNG
ncbi:MAG: efflux transporter outer membrane subunit [Novosphingobium sp.]|nr:efflux transporter outer membrane subunit [Novosphingobium sp.]